MPGIVFYVLQQNPLVVFQSQQDLEAGTAKLRVRRGVHDRLRVQLEAVVLERRLHGFDESLRLDLRLAQGPVEIRIALALGAHGALGLVQPPLGQRPLARLALGGQIDRRRRARA